MSIMSDMSISTYRHIRQLLLIKEKNERKRFSKQNHAVFALQDRNYM